MIRGMGTFSQIIGLVVHVQITMVDEDRQMHLSNSAAGVSMLVVGSQT